MEKPTSWLNFQILNFVIQHTQIINSLDARDRDQDAASYELSCKFYKQHPTDNSRSAYRVDFIYNTRYPNQEINDDITVFVEVTEGKPPTFNILKFIIH